MAGRSAASTSASAIQQSQRSRRVSGNPRSSSSPSSKPPLSKHHPYRIEVQDVNPVSVTFLLSLRPPPISSLRKQEANRLRASLAPGEAAAASSKSRVRGASEAAAPRHDSRSRRPPPLQDAEESPSSSDFEDEEGDYGGQAGDQVEWPSDDGGTVVDPNETLPNGEDDEDPWEESEEEGEEEEEERLERLRSQKDRQHQVFLEHHAAAADRAETTTITSPSALVLTRINATTSPDDSSVSPVSRLFSEGISIMVDGRSWKHVLMSDSSKNAGEAIVVVFGLRPGHQAKIEICVGPEAVSYAVGRARKMLKRRRIGNAVMAQNGRAVAGEEANEPASRLDEGEVYEMRSRSTHLDATRALPSSSRLASPARSRSNSFNGLTTSAISTAVQLHHTSSADSSDALAILPSPPASAPPHIGNNHIGSDFPASEHPQDPHTAAQISSLQVELQQATEARTALSADVRKARKEASRAESALRNEIEAVKRGLDRMSGTDHRSKQKVLALQESIRQASSLAEEYEEETVSVEGGLDEWKQKEEQEDERLEEVRAQAQEREDNLAAVLKETAEILNSKQKEVDKSEAKLADLQAQVDKLENGTLAAMLEELKALEEEIEATNNAPIDASAEIPQQQGPDSRSAIQHFAGGAHQQFPGVGGKVRGPGRGSGRFGGKRKHHAAAGSMGGLSHLSNESSSGAGASNGGRSVSQPNSSASASTSFALNPHNPEFVPSSVLLAQAQEQQQRDQQHSSSNSPSSHVAFLSSRHEATSSVPNILTNMGGTVSTFQPFSPMRPSPPTSETQHSSPSHFHANAAIPFGENQANSSGGMAASRWPPTSAAIASVNSSMDFPMANSRTAFGNAASSPWASPLLTARRGSGMLPPSSSALNNVNSSPSLSGAAPVNSGEKDIWSNPASSRSGNNIWGPLSGFGSSSALAGAGREGAVASGSGSVDSGGSMSGHHRASNGSGSGAGPYHHSPPLPHAHAHSAFAGFSHHYGQSSNSAPQSPITNTFTGVGANPAAFNWDSSYPDENGSAGSKIQSPTQLAALQAFQGNGFASGAGMGSNRSTVRSPVGIQAPAVVSPVSMPSDSPPISSSSESPSAIAPVSTGGSKAHANQRSFASVAAKQ